MATPSDVQDDKSMGEELWRHSSPTSTRMWEFLELVNKKHNLQLQSYHDLYRWSIEDIAAFWGEVWHFTGIRASTQFEQVRNHVTQGRSLCSDYSGG